jgi:cyclin B
MLVAIKYEEIYAPELQDFVYISDKAFSRKDLLEMEGVLLNVLGFLLTVPISHIFDTCFLKIVNMTQPQDVSEKTNHML